jgi:hypothetical protein
MAPFIGCCSCSCYSHKVNSNSETFVFVCDFQVKKKKSKSGCTAPCLWLLPWVGGPGWLVVPAAAAIPEQDLEPSSRCAAPMTRRPACCCSPPAATLMMCGRRGTLTDLPHAGEYHGISPRTRLLLSCWKLSVYHVINYLVVCLEFVWRPDFLWFGIL